MQGREDLDKILMRDVKINLGKIKDKVKRFKEYLDDKLKEYEIGNIKSNLGKIKEYGPAIAGYAL
ncbi:MAG: hypothetical protein RXO36_08305, partial [Candidatus Nanopusillus acidilobi]